MSRKHVQLIYCALGSFVYFKIALDVAFYADVTVIGALVLGGLTASVIYIAPIVSIKKVPVVLSWLGICIANSLVAKFIVSGFSQKLNGEMGRSSGLFFSIRDWEEVVVFALIICVPLLLHRFINTKSKHTT